MGRLEGSKTKNFGTNLPIEIGGYRYSRSACLVTTSVFNEIKGEKKLKLLIDNFDLVVTKETVEFYGEISKKDILIANYLSSRYEG